MASPGYDIAIVGGGLVGASLATALRGSGRRILLVEAFAPDSAAQPSFDERTTALGNASRRIFEALGLWQAMRSHAAPITSIHVSDAGRFAFARLEAAKLGLEALGYVVPNRVLGRALWSSLAGQSDITLRVPARLHSLEQGSDGGMLLGIEEGGTNTIETARLVVACDGGASRVRELLGIPATVDDYGQQAVVASLLTDAANDGTAHERFTPAGPMALLPLATGPEAGWRTLVWAARPEDARRLMTLEAPRFLREWQQAFGWRAGRALKLGTRACYPLALTRSDASVAARVVLIGNAAQALHPVAGQGFNLGLRDAAALAELLVDGGDPGDAELLARFAASREADRDGVVRFTDTLVRVFSDDRPLVGGLRDAGLLLFDLLPPAKQVLSRVSLGFGRRAPRLARGLPLR
jgi:2-octaprenyl-6-methoxyphenol hydroxylase